MPFRFSYDTYQDVRNNLFLYSLPFLVVAGFFTFAGVLPPEHQRAITGALAYIRSVEPWKSVVSAGIGIVVFSAVAFLLIELTIAIETEAPCINVRRDLSSALSNRGSAALPPRSARR